MSQSHRGQEKIRDTERTQALGQGSFLDVGMSDQMLGAISKRGRPAMSVRTLARSSLRRPGSSSASMSPQKQTSPSSKRA
jgi:hypothetical protein